MKKLALALLPAVLLSAAGAPADIYGDRGKEWIRTHPFYISGLLLRPESFNASTYLGAGLNTLLAWKPREGYYFAQGARANIPWHYHIYHERYGQTPAEVFSHVQGYVENYPGCTGLQFGDEPQVEQMSDWARYLDLLRAAYPEKLIYCNAFPGSGSGYRDYIDQFARLVRGDVLMVDIYPFDTSGGTSSSYFENLTDVRAAAQRYGRPYWLYVQAYETEGRRLPSESDLRMQVFSALAYGYTGIAYFTYDGYDRSLVTIDGTPTAMYPHAAAVNAEVLRLGESLRFLESTDVRFIPGEHEEGFLWWTWTAKNDTPRGLSDWSAGAGGDPHILNVTTSGDEESENGLIGFFTDDADNHFFMLVNLDHGMGESSASTRLQFNIEFDAGVTWLLRLDRQTGKEQFVLLNDHTLDITLPGGTGELFGYTRFPSLIMGDANVDGVVDDADLSLLLAHWTGAGGTGGTWGGGDFDGNGTVSDVDLSFLLAHWTGALGPDSIGVPEPATMGCLSLALPMLLRRRRG